MRIVSSLAVRDIGMPLKILSECTISASVWTRWRESSGTSSGSQMLPPGVSSSGCICASLMKLTRSASVPSRRSSPIRTNGGPCAGRNIMRSPPMCTSCAGLRACTVNSDGALATCSSTNSGSNLTRSPSTV